jgi:uncharacterized cupin superfamily protein
VASVLGEQTKGQYSIMEQLMPAAAGPPPHVYEHGDEIFYVLDGEMAMQWATKSSLLPRARWFGFPQGRRTPLR